MRCRYILALFLPLLVVASPLPNDPNLAPETDAITHANHIFNAVHSSMRQFGSSLNHNGMSIFIATVPEDTELYHGTSTKYRVNGTQWLAFEPEHALIFARGRRGPPPYHTPGDDHAPPAGAEDRMPKGPYHPDGMSSRPELETEDAGKKHDLAHDQPRKPEGKGRPHITHDDKGSHNPTDKESHQDGPHHRPPPPHDDLPHRCPPGEGYLPCSGPPGEGHGEPPDERIEHHGEHHDDRDHPRHHGPLHHGFLDEHDGPHHGHGHPEFSFPTVGYWVHRLGDLLRNPKRRHASPTSVSPCETTQIEGIEVRNGQETLASDSPEDQSSGYLHTYRTKHNLRLLYVDGQSAAKSQKGTLDTQDVLLLKNSIDHDSGMFNEEERANQLCKLANEQWDNRIDGILRMEGGFEIILCDFAAHLDVVSIAKTNPKAAGGFGGGADDGDGFNYYRAVAARYHGIGGNRVVLDYEQFVSAFAYPEAVYFDDSGRPRINNESGSIDDVRQAVDNMVLRTADDNKAVNWQAIVDMIVARYAERIEYLASGSLTTLSTLQAEVDRALRPFIDYNIRNSTLEIERCTSQFIPDHVSTTSTNVAAQAIRELTHTLCTSLVVVSAQTDYTAALDQIKQLKDYLAWTTWKQCRGCTLDEICFLPIWPVGTAEDFEQPKCRSDVSLIPGRYWNDFGGPGRRGPGPPKRMEKIG
ncbi:hypothetical protein E4T45_06806 [Aureobasidium sp. EXF-8846]|nr:hypothetical protein E4T45_06806 [Aureobasidium sp. EXF-8846]